MTKQEEIREGMIAVLKGSWDVEEFAIHDGYDLDEEKATDKLLKYLHSQGVVIKVDREWDIGSTDAHGTICNSACHNMERLLLKEAGYVAVEPLMKE